MLMIATLMGLRISEIMGLHWGDIDFTEGEFSIQRRWYRGDISEATKTPAGRRVLKLGPLVDDLKRRYPGPHAAGKYIFVGPDGVVPPDEREILRNELRPILKRLGLYYPGMGWHVFRRANVTYRQTIGGATPLETQRAAGHANLNMTLGYTLIDLDRQQEQATRMYEAIMGPTEGPKQ